MDKDTKRVIFTLTSVYLVLDIIGLLLALFADVWEMFAAMTIIGVAISFVSFFAWLSTKLFK